MTFNIKRSYIIAILLISISMFIFAQEQQRPEDFIAKISFERSVINVGEIDKDNKGIRLEFPFVNTGNAPLVLTYVHASCSCVRLEYPRHPIAPGDTSLISATLLPSSIHERDFKRNILIKSNAEQRDIRLFITGKLK